MNDSDKKMIIDAGLKNMELMINRLDECAARLTQQGNEVEAVGVTHALDNLRSNMRNIEEANS